MGSRSARRHCRVAALRDALVSHARGRIFLTSDLHFDHSNIIRYCNRPFASTAIMNDVLIYNWNLDIKEHDTVFFLGDLAPFQKRPRLNYWLHQLKGNIVCIQGSHDLPHFGISHMTLDHDGYKFLLVHDPGLDPEYGGSSILQDWKGWMIHGHTHNNDMRHRPFINGQNKTINVSVELTGYKPVSLEYLLLLDLDNIKRMETIASKPERW